MVIPARSPSVEAASTVSGATSVGKRPVFNSNSVSSAVSYLEKYTNLRNRTVSDLVKETVSRMNNQGSTSLPEPCTSAAEAPSMPVPERSASFSPALNAATSSASTLHTALPLERNPPMILTAADLFAPSPSSVDISRHSSNQLPPNPVTFSAQPVTTPAYAAVQSGHEEPPRFPPPTCAPTSAAYPANSNSMSNIVQALLRSYEHSRLASAEALTPRVPEAAAAGPVAAAYASLIALVPSQACSQSAPHMVQQEKASPQSEIVPTIARPLSPFTATTVPNASQSLPADLLLRSPCPSMAASYTRGVTGWPCPLFKHPFVPGDTVSGLSMPPFPLDFSLPNTACEPTAATAESLPQSILGRLLENPSKRPRAVEVPTVTPLARWASQHSSEESALHALVRALPKLSQPLHRDHSLSNLADLCQSSRVPVSSSEGNGQEAPGAYRRKQPRLSSGVSSGEAPKVSGDVSRGVQHSSSLPPQLHSAVHGALPGSAALTEA